jgi:ligand-binding SRPBCC domain-containing protein
MPANAHELADWHFRAGAIDRLLPPWEDVEILERPGAMADGAVARFRMKKFGIGIEWVARHHDVEPGRGFTDTQERGPFSSWVHRHSFLPEGDRSSMLKTASSTSCRAACLGAPSAAARWRATWSGCSRGATRARGMTCITTRGSWASGCTSR